MPTIKNCLPEMGVPNLVMLQICQLACLTFEILHTVLIDAWRGRLLLNNFWVKRVKLNLPTRKCASLQSGRSQFW